MTTKGNVDLIIQAKNDASKALDAITSSLKKLKDQQIIVGNAAEKTDGQLSALSLELSKLRTNAQNLQQLANIGNVLNKASAAMQAQAQAAEDAARAQADLATQNQKLQTQQTETAASLKTANSELTKQKTAVTEAKAALAALTKESTALSTGQRNTQRSLDAVTKLIVTQEAALAAATQKHAALAAAVDATDKPTKRLTTSLEAAEKALAKRQAALEASQSKEAALRDTLQQNSAAQEANNAAVAAATQTLANQKKAAETAQSSVAKLNLEAGSLAKSQQSVEREMAKATSVTEGLKSGLDQAQTEYKALEAAANQAKAAVGATAAVTTDVGQAAVQAANELATFAARAKALQSAKGTTGVTSIGINATDVEQAVAALSNARSVVTAVQQDYSKAAVSAQDLNTAIEAAGKASSTIQAVGSAVSSQKQAIDAAYTSWKQAEDEVKRLAIAMRDAAEPSETLAAAFGTAQANARLAKNEFLNQKSVGEQLAQTLQKAGVGAGTLNSAEAVLAATSRSAASTLSAAADATAKMSRAQSEATNTTSRFRSILDTLQATGNSWAVAAGKAAAGIAQIRSGAASASGPVGSLASELKGLAAQVIGLYAIKQGLEGIIDTSNKFDAIKAQLGVAFAGDVNKANVALDYSMQVATNLKLPLLETAKGYAQLAAAARGTSLEGEGVNKIFTAFAQAARVTRTSSADLNGIFIALTQSISKGKVQAEELRGQLGDRFPGAVQIMAQALGVSTQKLDKMLQAGELTTETLVRMAAEVSKRVAPELANALNSPQAKIQAFKNAWTELELKLAQSGFLDAVANAAQKLGDALSKPETIKAVNDLGLALAELVNYIASIDDPLGKLKTGLEVLIGLQVLSWVSGIVSGLTTLATGLYTVGAASTALATGGIAALVIGLVALIGYLGTLAYDNFPAFREAIWSIGTVCQEVGSTIQLAFELAFAYVKQAILGFVHDVNTTWTGLINDLASSAASVGNFFGSDSLNGFAQQAAKDNQDAANASQKAWADAGKDIDAAWDAYYKRNKAREDEIAAERKKYADQAVADAKKVANATSTSGTTTGKNTGPGLSTVQGPTDAYKPDTSKADEAAAKKRATLEQKVANEISSIRARLDTNTANNLDTQIAGVEEKYRGLYADLTKLGLDQNSAEWKQVDALKAQEIQLTRNRAAKAADEAQAKKVRDAEKNINDLFTLRRDLLEQIKYARSQGDYSTVDKLTTQFNSVNAQLKTAIDAQIAYWQAAGGPKADLAIAKLKAQADGLTNVKNNTILTANTIGNQLGSSLASFGDEFLSNIKETGNVFTSLRDSFESFASSFLLKIAQMILKQQLFNALQSASTASSGWFGTVLGAAASAVGSAHTGGVVASTGLNQVSVNPGVFSGATKYHTGGVVGLQPWEQPIIAKKGEEVLTQSDPRHINNLSSGNSTSGGNSNGSMPNFQIINAIDSDEVVQKGLSSPAGTQAILNIVKANRNKIKGLVG